MKFKIIHLSDIHFREANISQDLVVESLSRKLEDLFKDDQTEKILIISGDIAQSGKQKEYDNAKVFIKRIIDNCDVNAEYVFLIPGNHDVQRGTIKPVYLKWWYQFENEESLLENLKTVESSTHLKDKLQNYYLFEKEVMNDKIEFGEFNEYVYELPISNECNDLKIKIVGLNSALFCGYDGDDAGKLALGLEQVSNCEKIIDNEKELVISFVHHPFVCFHTCEEATLNVLKRFSDIILTGHIHKAKNTDSVDGNTGKTLYVSAGASFLTRETENSFNVLEIDLCELKGKIEYYKYKTDEHIWIQNKDINRDSDGIFNFEIKGKDVVQKNITPSVEIKEKKEVEIVSQFEIVNSPRINSLNNYPRPKPYFSGRLDDLRKLKEAFDSYPLFMIEGAGGIGKTQIVAKFIEQEHLDKRVVWIDCNKDSQIEDIISGAGFEELLKGKEKSDREKFSAFKDKIEENNLVLFLDNYQEVEDNPIFKGFLNFLNEFQDTGHVIIIGRDNIISPSFQLKKIPITGMGKESLEHARKLLLYSYPEALNITDETLLEVCDILKGVPLAIDLAVYLLSGDVKVKDIIFEAVKNPDENINRLLNEIFTRTDAKEYEKLFLKEFSIFRSKTTLDEINNIIQVLEKESAIKSLEKRNLLYKDNKTYELHPIIREYCYQLLENKNTLHDIASAYYIKKRKELLDAELEEKIYYHLSVNQDWTQIASSIELYGRDFIRQGYLDRLQQMIAEVNSQNIQLPIFDIFSGIIAEVKGNWDIALEYFKIASKSDKEYIFIEGTILQGEMLYIKGDVKQADAYFRLALEYTNGKREYKKLNAMALNGIGVILDFNGKSNDALSKYEDALKISKELNENEDIASCLQNIASIKIIKGEINEGSSLLEHALIIEKEIDNKAGIANILISIGDYKYAKGDTKDALDLYKQSLKIHKNAGKKLGIASSFNAIANIHITNGEILDALNLYEKCLEINKEIGNELGVANSIKNIASVKDIVGETNNALLLLEQSLSIYESREYKKGIAVVLNALSRIRNQQGDYKGAINFSEKSLSIHKELGDRIGICKTLSIMAQIKSAKNDYKGALKLCEEALDISYDLDNKDGIALSLNDIGTIKSSLGETSKALELFDQSLKVYEKIGYKMGIAIALSNIASINEKNEKQEALNIYRKCLAIYEEVGSKISIANISLNIGNLLFSQNIDLIIAFEYILKALAIYNQLKSKNHTHLLSKLKVIRKNLGLPKYKSLISSAFDSLDKDLQLFINRQELFDEPVISEQKIGRNDPCPCGSGKKYKHCHGKEL